MKLDFRHKDATFEVECEPGERILYAGLRAGVPLPYECATGTCGTCRARAKPGTVRELWTQAPGRKVLKPERGDFLMCQSVAETDCAVLVPGRLRDAGGRALPAHRRATLEAFERLNDDVMSFELTLDAPMRYHAGQFVVVRVPGMDGFRGYSMTNYAQGTSTLSFVIKRLAAGGFSQWLFEQGAGGVELELFGPLGDAIFNPEEDKNLLCIAGGSGIAGMMAILEHCQTSAYFDAHEGRVFFGVRTFADAFFLDELAQFKARAQNNLHITIALSDEAPPPDAVANRHPGLAYDVGFVHEVAARQMQGRYDNVVSFVAGPPPMVDATLRHLIVKAKLPRANIRYDKFS